MSESEILLSFIIPVCNAENTIVRQLESICSSAQNAGLTGEFEVIVVLNGCTDRTAVFVKEYEKKHARVYHIFSQPGVSNARNAGIEGARGRWLVFADADDCMMPNAVDTLKRDAQSGEADLYVYGYNSGNKKRSVVKKQTDEMFMDDAEHAICRMLMNPTQYMQVWAKLFSREIIEEHHIRFHEQLSVAEDSDFTLKYAMHVKNIKFCAATIYSYMLSSGSVMRTFDGKKATQYTFAMEETSKYIAGASGEIKNAFTVYVLMHLNIVMVREVFDKNNSLGWKEKCRMMVNIASNGVFGKAVRDIPVRKCFCVRLLPALCLKLKLHSLGGGIYYARSLLNYWRYQKSASGVSHSAGLQG